LVANEKSSQELYNMTRGCKIDKQDAPYIMTFTIVDWLYALEDFKHKMIICDSLNYCIDKKKLRVYSYVIMDTHMHLLAASGDNDLSGFVRDFKKHTANEIINSYLMKGDETSKEILNRFEYAATKHSRNKKYQVWQHKSYPEEIDTPKFTLSKIRYIHNNPVDAGLVNRPQDYLFSSAVDYTGGKSPVNVELMNLHNLMW
jgi:REP element-mobilizing transposase RayT